MNYKHKKIFLFSRVFLFAIFFVRFLSGAKKPHVLLYPGMDCEIIYDVFYISLPAHLNPPGGLGSGAGGLGIFLCMEQ